MVRLTVAAAAILMMSACSGLIDDGGSGGLTAQEIQARKLWLDKALPLLETNCRTCHNGSRDNIAFAGPMDAAGLDIRDTILAYTPPVINLDAAASSRLLTKGIHEGPQLDAGQTSDLLDWINAEKEAAAAGTGTPVTTVSTTPFFVNVCTSGLPDSPSAPNVNCLFTTVPLDAVGETGAVGGSITFIAQSLSSGLYLNNLKLIPGAGGAFIEHPLFVSLPDGADPKADTIDRFFSVKMNLMAGASATDEQIQGGTAAFVGFLAVDKLAIHFKKVSPFVVDGTGPVVTGCKKLPEFKANTVPTMATNCKSCHGGQNANATSAMNITGLDGADDAIVLKACNEVRNRVNFQDIPNSGMLLAPKPPNANHPFTFGGAIGPYNTFAAAVDPWIQAEKTAP